MQEQINREAAVVLSLDLVTQSAIEAGVVGGPDARSKVAQELGLEMEPVQVPVQLMLQDGGGGLGDAGGSIGEELVNTLVMEVQAVSFSMTLAEHLKSDAHKQKALLKSAGQELWKATEIGILDAMESTPYVKIFAEIVSPYVARFLANEGVWEGKGDD